MDCKAINKILRWIAIGSWIGSATLLSACAQHGSARPAGKRTANGTARRSDPLLGKWVMIGDNGTGAAGTTADFRPNGTVVFRKNHKKMTIRYRRETGQAWVNRRTAGLCLPGKGAEVDELREPGVQMIEFAGPDGKFIDYGSSLLTLDP